MSAARFEKSVQRGLGKFSPTSKVVQEYTARQVVKKVVLVMLASGILVILEASFFIASFKDGSYHLGENAMSFR